MAYHLEMIKLAAATHLNDLVDIVHNENGFENNKNPDLYSCITSLRKDEFQVNGSPSKITRVFLLTDDSNSYAGVGWIVSCQVTNCMRCASTFGLFNLKNHCRACGNIVCGLCTERGVIVKDIADVGPVKVCKNCCDGEQVRYINSLHFTLQTIFLHSASLYLSLYL